MKKGRRAHARTGPRSSFWIRLGLFGALGVLVLGMTGFIFWSRQTPMAAESSRPAEAALTVTMAGFDPEVLSIPAGRPFVLRLVNPDSPFHTDGGGVHGFTVPALGVDLRVQPRSTRTVELPAVAPGKYEFYCDTCCGGKESPAMRGTLEVAA